MALLLACTPAGGSSEAAMFVWQEPLREGAAMLHLRVAEL